MTIYSTLFEAENLHKHKKFMAKEVYFCCIFISNKFFNYLENSLSFKNEEALIIIRANRKAMKECLDNFASFTPTNIDRAMIVRSVVCFHTTKVDKETVNDKKCETGFADNDLSKLCPTLMVKIVFKLYTECLKFFEIHPLNQKNKGKLYRQLRIADKISADLNRLVILCTDHQGANCVANKFYVNIKLIDQYTKREIQLD